MGHKPRNADYTKEYNRKGILRILRHQAMSRAELARATGLTRAATSLIVEELLNRGDVRQLPPQSVGRGRKAMPVALNGSCGYALAVDLTRKGYFLGLCDMAGQVLKQMQLPARAGLEQILSCLRQLMELVEPERILGVGVSSPGPLDCPAGRILNPPRFEQWHGVDIGPILTKELGIPAYLEHDVCAMALYQLEMGKSRNFMLLLVDVGIGAAIMSDGTLLGNSRHFTGELGHTSIRFDGRQCECGNRGCLETYAAIPALLEGSRYRSWQELVDHVRQDPEAARLLDQQATYLSAGLINLLNLIPVDTLYLAGDIRYRYELLAQKLQQAFGSKALFRGNSRLQIFPAVEAPDIGILSAAEVVFSRFFTV